MNKNLVIGIFCLLALIVTIAILLDRYRHRRKKTKTNIVRGINLNNTCVQDCLRENNNNPLCSDICANGVPPGVQQRCVIKGMAENPDLGLGAIISFCTSSFGPGPPDPNELQCNPICYMLGCGNISTCEEKCMSV